MDAMIEGGLRGPQVCRLTGISYRQLDYWARSKLVPPSIRPAHGSGSFRLYSFDDLVYLKLIKNLLDTGVSLQRVREAVQYLRLADLDLGATTLISDGTSIYACQSPEEVCNLVRSGGFFGIAVGPIVEELRAALKAEN